MSLPTPFLEYIPRVYQRNPDAATLALSTLMDALMAEWKAEALSFVEIRDAVRCPAGMLDEFGAMIAASVKEGDSENTKRIKIANAIMTHKKRGQWEYDAKIRIDAITGDSASLVSNVLTDQWITCGINPGSAYYWGTLGADGTDDDMGMYLTANGTEMEISGNIYIDLGGSGYASLIPRIVDEIKTDICPAYMRVYLGYLGSAGEFVQYPGGIIG
jgi:hypothetical protein